MRLTSVATYVISGIQRAGLCCADENELGNEQTAEQEGEGVCEPFAVGKRSREHYDGG